MNETGKEDFALDGRAVWNKMRRITFPGNHSDPRNYRIPIIVVGLVSLEGISSGTVRMDDLAERAPIYAG